jgi:hypothetical protein
MEPIARHHQHVDADVLEHGSPPRPRSGAPILASAAVAVLAIMSGTINGTTASANSGWITCGV